jgi:hypothetical protein
MSRMIADEGKCRKANSEEQQPENKRWRRQLRGCYWRRHAGEENHEHKHELEHGREHEDEQQSESKKEYEKDVLAKALDLLAFLDCSSGPCWPCSSCSYFQESGISCGPEVSTNLRGCSGAKVQH